MWQRNVDLFHCSTCSVTLRATGNSNEMWIHFIVLRRVIDAIDLELKSAGNNNVMRIHFHCCSVCRLKTNWISNEMWIYFIAFLLQPRTGLGLKEIAIKCALILIALYWNHVYISEILEVTALLISITQWNVNLFHCFSLCPLENENC